MEKQALLVFQSHACNKKARWENFDGQYNLFFSNSISQSVFYLTHEFISCIVTESPKSGSLSQDSVIYFRTCFPTIPLVIYGHDSHSEIMHEWLTEGHIYFIPSGKANKLTKELPLIIAENAFAADLKTFNIDAEQCSVRVKKALRLIRKDFFNKDLTISKIAFLLNVHRSHFEREFKSQCRISPKQLIIGLKLYYSTYLMKNDGMKLRHVAQIAGFSDYYSYSKIFRKYLDMTPTQYRCLALNADFGSNFNHVL